MKKQTMRLGAAMATLALGAGLLVSAGPAVAGAPGKWTKVSQQDVSLIAEPGLLRLDNGNLLVVYNRDQPDGDEAIGYTIVRPNGKTLAQGTVVKNWSAIISDPKPIRISDSRVAVVFSGIRTTSASSPYNSGAMYSASSGAGGGSWTLDTTSLTKSTSAYASYGTSALTLPGGTPVVSFPLNSSITWHQGFDSSNPASANDSSFSNGSCCLYDTKLARDSKSGETFIGWYSNGDKNGHWVRRILPTTGAMQKASGSTDGGSSLSPDQSVALTDRQRGGTYLAYCRGYPTCKNIALWKVGAAKAKTVPKSKGADTVAVARGPGGRLWVLWDNNSTSKIYATSTNPSVGRFGPVRTLNLPRGSSSSYRLSAEGSASRTVDVVVNNNSGLYHSQIRPGLSLSASPRKWDGDRRTTVKFTVKDTGSPVANAQVKVAGKSDRTNGQGIAKITFGAGTRPGKYKATATKSGFYRGAVVLRVTR